MMGEGRRYWPNRADNTTLRGHHQGVRSESRPHVLHGDGSDPAPRNTQADRVYHVPDSSFCLKKSTCFRMELSCWTPFSIHWMECRAVAW